MRCNGVRFYVQQEGRVSENQAIQRSLGSQLESSVVGFSLIASTMSTNLLLVCLEAFCNMPKSNI